MALDVLGWVHRGGKLHLTLVLPDGTRSLIPATWTDLNAHKELVKQAQPALLASCAQLLQARTVVDALQGSGASADTMSFSRVTTEKRVRLRVAKSRKMRRTRKCSQ
jgi:hypothetical protein